jgi:hypothetical protein
MDAIFGRFGERQIMFVAKKNNDLTSTEFGKLELVDREIFFISFNRRDT